MQHDPEESKSKGMACNHCKMTVENNHSVNPAGVESASVDLSTGNVNIRAIH